ncbi:MAG: hypothetical protein KTR19_00475 [Hyphomicrobiales bacterium]|nr:hypothetical protein [Hyphomicrobiales bacterium]
MAISILLLVLFAAVSWAVGTTQDDPGPGAFRFDFGRQTVTGILEAKPYPLVHVKQGSERIPAGHTIILSGQGKNGAISRAEPLDGKLVEASGVILKRGDLDMLQLRGGEAGLSAKDGQGGMIAPKPEELGRWKVAGEICDGKCLAGAMRPGTGLAHRACANLCLAGGIAPVFVSSKPVEGSEFLLMAESDGGPLGDWFYDYTAVYISLEGNVERRGGLLVFKADPDTIEVLK